MQRFKVTVAVVGREAPEVAYVYGETEEQAAEKFVEALEEFGAEIIGYGAIPVQKYGA